MDIYTDKEEFPIFLPKVNFCCVKIIARNNFNKEIAFIEKNTNDKFSLVCNIGPLEVFPLVIENEMKLRHVRLEIEYTHINVKNREMKEKRHAWLFEPKSLIFSFHDAMQPEIYITLPKGWVIGGNSFANIIQRKTSKEGFKFGMKYQTIPRIPPENVNEGIQTADDLDGGYKSVKFHLPFIKNIDGKNSYHYVIRSDSYDSYRNEIVNSDPDRITNKFNYHVEIAYKFAALALIPIFFLILSTISFLSIILKNEVLLTNGFIMPYLIVVLSYGFFLFTLIKEGYHIPLMKWATITFIWSMFVIILSIFMNIFNPTINASQIYVVNMSLKTIICNI